MQALGAQGGNTWIANSANFRREEMATPLSSTPKAKRAKVNKAAKASPTVVNGVRPPPAVGKRPFSRGAILKIRLENFL